MKVRQSLCAYCKGSRRLCGRPVCPILLRLRSQVEVSGRIGGRFVYGNSPPSTLVGEWGYPRVRVGPSVVPLIGGEASLYDDPEGWWGNLELEDIIRLRSAQVYSFFTTRVRWPLGNRLLESVREISLSSRPVYTEVELSKPPRLRLWFDGVLAPVGPTGRARSLKADNPHVPRRVDQLVGDVDAKARVAAVELYNAGISVYHIVRLLQSGLLGLRVERRLVPTRWAITAVDSMLGDELKRKVRYYKELGSLLLFHTDYIGNHYEILLLPGVYKLEVVEVWLPRSVWVKGGKPYVASNMETLHTRGFKVMDGGHYAMRLPILEYLHRIRRQATVLAVREIRPEYYAPVGCWQIRESVRNALKGEPEKPETVEEALELMSGRLKTGLELIARASSIAMGYGRQRRLVDY